ncbi:uncharacterized protein [Prorops nasuta]|uniref:uncharacterized protein n=1 Tax=Prorops nasuta TaxID=863751 RepID=UPI0034CEC3A0
MSKIPGTYEFMWSENFEEFMTYVGLAECAGKFLQSKPIVQFKEDNGTWTLIVNQDGVITTSTFQLGKPYKEYLPHLTMGLKCITTREGNNFKMTTYLENRTFSRLYEFTDDGMTANLYSDENGVTSKRVYRRIN